MSGPSIEVYRDLWDQLHAHDWYWPMTDDPRVSARGRGNEERLRKMSVEAGAESLFDAFRAWGWDKGPLPPRP